MKVSLGERAYFMYPGWSLRLQSSYTAYVTFTNDTAPVSQRGNSDKQATSSCSPAVKNCLFLPFTAQTMVYKNQFNYTLTT